MIPADFRLSVTNCDTGGVCQTVFLQNITGISINNDLIDFFYFQ